MDDPPPDAGASDRGDGRAGAGTAAAVRTGGRGQGDLP